MERQVTVTLPEELHARLEAEAQRRQVTPAEIIAEALEALLASDGNGRERPLWQDLVELGQRAREEDPTPLPADLAEQVDHYIYGIPKR